jgi:hypothetical protein
MIDHRPLAEQLLKPVRSGKIRLHVGERRLSLVSERELNLAKLYRLKSRCCLEPVAEARERRRRHRFEDVHLRDERLHDCPHAFKRMNCAEEIAGGEILFDFLELVEQLLEPKLVRLMNDDEEHLVVLGRGRARALERQQLLQIQIIGIRQGWHTLTCSMPLAWTSTRDDVIRLSCRRFNDSTV